MRRVLLVGLGCICILSSASAQQRTMRQDAPGLLRQWPKSGAWEVLLARGSEGDLICAMVTGIRMQPNGDAYVWGLRDRHKKVALVISDRSSQAVAGDAIRVSVDGALVGSYAVTMRRTMDGMNSVAAELSPTDVGKLTTFFRLGGRIAYGTEAANYAETLQGAAVAFNYFAQCGLEVDQLNTARPGM